MKKALLLMLALILLSLYPVSAENTATMGNAPVNVEEGNRIRLDVNPIYESILDDELIVDASEKFSVSAPRQFSSASAAVEYVRDQAKERENSIHINVTSEVLEQLDLQNLNDIFYHTGDPEEGDYLRLNIGYMSVNCSETYDDGYDVEYYFAYWDTPDQQSELDSACASIIGSFKLDDNATDYDKIRAIYEWITANVEYDQDEYESHGTHPTAYGTYAAAVEKLAVCQGYSTLLYRLALTLGIDCRVITSDSLDHAWNIVRLDDLYYYLDSTWDNSTFSYFLKGSSDFMGHSCRDSEYADSVFASAYPLAAWEYKLAQHAGYTDILGYAPDYVLTDVDGNTIHTAAKDGRSKVLVYFEYWCPFSPALIETLVGKTFPGVDIYLIEHSRAAYAERAQKIADSFPKPECAQYFIAPYNDGDITPAYTAFRSIDFESGIQDTYDNSPSFYLINSKNQIVQAHHGHVDNFDKLIAHYLVDADAPLTLDKTDDHGNHDWELSVWIRKPTQTKTGLGKYICANCGKVKEEIVPNTLGSITGKCGANANWVFNANSRILTISGSGKLYNNAERPNWIGWIAPGETKHYFYCGDYIYCDQVEYIVVEEGITGLDASMFSGFNNLKYIGFPSTLNTLNVGGYYSLPRGDKIKGLNVVFRGSYPDTGIDEYYEEGTDICFYYPENSSSWVNALEDGGWFADGRGYGLMEVPCFGIGEELLDPDHIFVPQKRRCVKSVEYVGDFVCIDCGKTVDVSFGEESFIEEPDGYTDILGYAPDYTLTDADGNTISTAAKSGRSKVLVYFDYDEEISARLIESLVGKTFPNVDIYLIEYHEWNYSVREQTIANDYPKPECARYFISPDYFDGPSPAYYAYRDIDSASGILEDGIPALSFYIINSKNQIVLANHGYVDNLDQLIAHYLVDADAPLTLDRTDDHGNHDWQLVRWIRKPAEQKTGLGKYICSNCGKVKEEIAPNALGQITGICGTNASWIYDANKHLLTISGRGSLYNNIYTPTAIGWIKPGGTKYYASCQDYIYCDQVRYIVVEEGITDMGARMFADFINVQYIGFPSTLNTLNESGYSCFPYYEDCKSLKDVVFRGSYPNAGGYEIFDRGSEICFYYPKNNSSWAEALNEGGWFGSWYIDVPCFGIGDELLDPNHIFIPQKRRCGETVEYVGSFVCIDCGKTVNAHFGDYDIANLSQLVLPESLRTIEAEAFMNSDVEMVVIPAGCEVIDPTAFDSCDALFAVQYMGAIPEGAEAAFARYNVDVYDADGERSN